MHNQRMGLYGNFTFFLTVIWINTFAILYTKAVGN